METIHRLRRRGFQLVDVLLALVLLALLGAVAMSLFGASSLTLRQSQDRVEADALAQSLLEGYQGRAFELGLGPVPLPAARPGWTTSLDVRAVSGYPDNQLRELRALITWSFQGNARRLERCLTVANLRP